MWKIQIVLTLLGKISQVAFLLWNYQCFFHKIIHIVNHLEYFFRISSIEPKDSQGLPQILPQSAQFLPRACSRRSRNIPSLLPAQFVCITEKLLRLYETVCINFSWFGLVCVRIFVII